MPTSAELNAMPYGGAAAQNRGLSAAAFRARYQEHGLRLRFWKAFAAPSEAVGPGEEVPEQNGRLYIEQTLASTVRGLAYHTERKLYDAEWGTIEIGSTGISVLPDEVELVRLDRIAFTDVSWRRRELIQRGAGGSDLLQYAPATSIIQVLRAVDGDDVDSDDYALSGNGKSMVWDAPGSGAIEEDDYYLVEYRYQPRFEYLLDEQAVMQIGTDALFLPQRGVIRLLAPGEYTI